MKDKEKANIDSSEADINKQPQTRYVLSKQWNMYWQQIIQPSGTAQDETYGQARMLTALLVVLLLVLAIILPIWIFTNPEFATAPYISISIFLSLSMVYGLSRSRYYRLGAAMFIGLLPPTVVFIIATAPGAMTERMLALNFLVVAILLASIIFNIRATALLAITSLAIVSTFFFLPAVPFAVTYSFMVYVAVLSALFILSTIIRNSYSNQLHSSEVRYRQLFDQATIGILSADGEGHILTVNPAVLNMLGSPSEETTKKINLLTFPPLIEAGIADDIRRCFQTGSLIVTERPYISKWGKSMYFRLHITPVQDSKGQISSVQILIEDISKRKHSETQLQQQNRLLETVHEVFRAISTTLDTQQILSTVARATARAVDASSVYVCDWNQEQGTTTVLAEYIGTDASELEQKSDLNVTYNLAEDFGDNAAWLQDPKGYALVYLDDPHIAPEQRAHLEQYGAHSALVVTLRMPEKIIGYIEVWESRHKRHFTTEEIEIVKAIAQQAAAMVENAQLYQQVKEQQEYNQVLLEAMPELLFHLNSKGIFIDYRAENKQDLLIQPEQFLNQHYRDVLPLGISQQLATAIDAAIQTHQVQSFEYQTELAEQTKQMYEARVATTKIGTSIVVSRNITERKQAEQNRFKLAMEQEKTELLKQFISHLSHDLKTPLSVIRVNLSLLQRIHDPQKQPSRLETIHQQTQRLERLIQDILTVSRLDHIPGFVFELIDLNQLVNDITQQLRSLTEDKPLDITIELDSDLQPIQADKDELARALINLVENAISYTKQGRITMRTSRQADVVMIEVADTGMGIAEAKLPYIFNHFYRTDEARSKQTGGSGLGLAIVKKIIEGHRGSIDVESTQGVGTSFRITLPAVIDS